MINFDNIKGFDWDEHNIDKNYKKHNVTVTESEEIFKDSNIVIGKEVNINNEIRFVAYGKTTKRKYLTVVFTIRGDLIRIISARPQNKSERKIYNEKNKT